MHGRILLVFLVLLSACSQPQKNRPPKALIVIIDGLRPEYVTQEIMPRLNAFAAQGYTGLAHHAVYPTVTRVNSSSISTGSYPQTHGLTGNSMYIPSVANRVLSTGAKSDLELIESALDGKLLTTPTLAEIIEQHGMRVFAASSGSSGSGYLMNYRPGSGGLIHYEFTVPDTLHPAAEALIGPRPVTEEQPKLNLIRYAVNSLLHVGIDYLQADALLLWVTEPDGTAHANGIGAPATIEALKGVDREMGNLFDELAGRDLLDDITVFITSDHGFSTHTGSMSVRDLLIEKGLKETEESLDVVLAGGAIHVSTDHTSRIPEIIHTLQQTEWIGAIFTRDGLQGTLPFSSINWGHERSSDILVAYNWSDAQNEYGYTGEVTTPGVAGHGSTSPYDIRTFFAISGPQVKTQTLSSIPSSNVDLAPTVLHLLGLPSSPSMDGRILTEAFTYGPLLDSIDVQQEVLEAQTEGYRLMLDRSIVNGTTYVDGTRVER